MSHRGMKEEQAIKLAFWMNEIKDLISEFKYQDTKEERKIHKKEFKEFISNNDTLKRIRLEVKEMCEQFPIYK
jgi:glycine/serine hydroxymethyltransferase